MFTIRGDEEINLELFNYIKEHHPEQIEEVFKQDEVEILPDFLGFIATYYYLSKIIPLHFTVIDFGCGYNAQSFYFKNHKHYIGVDGWPGIKRFQAPGTDFYECHISEFIKNNKFDVDSVFAICSYVPDWNYRNRELVKENFSNVFIFYPSDRCIVVE
jgi:hypothetical protein